MITLSLLESIKIIMQKFIPIALLSTATIALSACTSGSTTSSATPVISPPPVSGPVSAPTNSAQTPIERFGALSVTGNRITDSQNRPISLSGVSHFWSNTGYGQEALYNPQVVQYLADEWNATLFRAAMGADENGSYLDEPEANVKRAQTVIDAAIDIGAYVIIDFHSHHAHEYPEKAIEFFTQMAKQYGDKPNVIYEIYNEPLNTANWAKDVKPYSERLIAAIRAIDPDNLIIVGSPTWSQDVDIVAQDPIVGYDNIAYTMHFYAGTHGEALRAKTKKALDAGLAIFVTEWGTINANGDGAVAHQSVKQWTEFMDKHCLSNANWSVSNKAEGASIFKPGTTQKGPWKDSDLTESAKVVKQIVKNGTRVCE